MTSFRDLIPESAKAAIEAAARKPKRGVPFATVTDGRSTRTDAIGSRGGAVPPFTVTEADQIFTRRRGREYAWLKDLILNTASERGEFHADSIAHEDLSERNQIGAAVSGLVNAGLLVSTGEHRRSNHPAAHGRRSYVYRLTAAGQASTRGRDAA